MADPTEPAPVAEARQIMSTQDAFVKRILGGSFAMAAAILAISLTGAGGEVAAIATTIGFGAFMIGTMAHASRHTEAWRSAAATLKEWDRRKLSVALDQTAPTTSAPLADPDDERWPAMRTILDRVRALGAGTESAAHVDEVTHAVEERLRAMLLDVATVREALEAERSLGGDGEATASRIARLDDALAVREGTVSQLVEHLRELHVELTLLDASALDPVVAELERLVLQVGAEREVDDVGQDERATRARLAEAAKRTGRRE